MPSPSPTVARSIEDLRHFHRAGEFLLGQGASAIAHFPADVRRVLGGRNPDTRLKLRVFASPRKGYTAEELDRLGEQCRRHNRVWGIKHVIAILRVPKANGHRSRIQLKAIRDG